MVRSVRAPALAGMLLVLLAQALPLLDAGADDGVGKTDSGNRYTGRHGGKLNLVSHGGGAPVTTSTIDDGLLWLARHQAKDGSWSPRGACPTGACVTSESDRADVGLTGLAVLPFLAAGYDPTRTEIFCNDPVTGKPVSFGAVVKDAVHFLLANENERGSFGAGSIRENGLATLALCEAAEMSGERPLETAAQGAVDHLVKLLGDAGWCTVGRIDPIGVGWCIMALKSAVLAGLDVPDEAFASAKVWIDELWGPKGICWRDGGSRHHSLTALCMLMTMYLDCQKTDPRLEPGTDALMADLPTWDTHTEEDAYYAYMGTLAIFMERVGEEPWRRWHVNNVRMLAAHQRSPAVPCLEGSWDTDPSGVDALLGGRVLGTALRTLSLETFYHYEEPIDPGK